MKIDFVVPGFSKCGTTTLCDLLDSHPDIFIPPAKEPGYFAENFEKGWNWYLDAFLSLGSERMVGDGSTTYSSHQFAEVACERLLKHNPACKFIFIARDPKRRLESSFREMHASGYKYAVMPDFDFGNALQQLPNMIADTRYWKLINFFRERVADSRMHVLFLEDLNRDPQAEYTRCLDFLQLPPHQLRNSQRRLNPAHTKTCDTAIMRWIRCNPSTARFWNRMSLKRQERLMRYFRLRKPFTAKIEWSEYATEVFEQQVVPDARRFLQHFGKSRDFWELGCGEPAKQAA